MFDALVDAARNRGIDILIGYYEASAKNAMVANHYESLGFVRADAESSATVWRLRISADNRALSTHIQWREIRNGRHHSETDSTVSRCAE